MEYFLSEQFIIYNFSSKSPLILNFFAMNDAYNRKLSLHKVL